ncbi:MAG TPA: YebC/PmpR family DNA-binding transcriptional regulator [Kofleriaceae bacterium]|jgi:YebC/PmpR family DNA-binding regulatory protein|nr:YebC/PmpR family DNA-binding transcriptional regulator [Kofleriaceae bacterium]
MGAQWKHRIKQASALVKTRVLGKLSKEIMLAAKGGADPAANSRLRVAVEAAKKASMPRDTLERAIKKGAGLLDEPANFELVTYEGFAPHQVPVMVECLTDNKNRTQQSIRTLFRKGQLGAVAWDFDHVGLIDATGAGDAETAAIEAGAQDVGDDADDEGAMRFYTNPTDVDTVAKALAAAGWTVSSLRLGWRPKHPVVLADDARGDVEQFLTELDADDDVQYIYAGLALS